MEKKEGVVYLDDLILTIQKGFYNTFDELGKLVNTLFRKWWVILGGGALIGGSMYLLYTQIEPVYRTSGIFQVQIISNYDVNEIIDDLQRVIDSRSYSQVEQILDIPSNLSGDIHSIKYFNRNPGIEELDSISLGVPFKLELEVSDPGVIPLFQQGLIKLITSNDYVNSRKELALENLKKEELYLQDEISELKDLKNSYAKNILASQSEDQTRGTVVAERSDPLSLYRQSSSLFRQQLRLEARELNLNEVVQVIKPFYFREKPDFPKLKNIVIYPSLIALLVLWIGAYFFEKRKAFRKRIQNA